MQRFGHKLENGKVRTQNILGMLLVLFFMLPAVAQAQCLLTLQGRITDEETKGRLQGATLIIEETKQSTTTDANGHYVLKGLCPGRYTITITHLECKPLSVHLHVERDMVQDFEMPHSISQLADVTVVGATSAKSGAIGTELKGKALDMTRGQSLGESLQKLSGVSVLQTGTTIYKPVIQGMHSNRVLILNNGIRQEGQQWGSEHAPEIDPFVANRFTVIKGASTLRYGSDAIGGVVLVEPRLLPTRPGISGEINTGFFSNNLMGFVSAMAEGNSARKPAFAWRLQGSAKRGGNARTPNYWLDNSGMSEYNFSVTAGLHKPNKGIELFYSQFNTKLGIFSGSHIGNVSDLVDIINNGKPPDYIIDAPFSYAIDRPFQRVTHHLVKAKSFLQTGDFGRLNVVLSYQYNWRREYDLKRFASSSSSPQLDIGLNTVGGDIAWDHYRGSKWKGTIGINASYQNNQYYQRFFIPNYEALNAGAYVIEKLSLHKLMLEAGLRYDYRQLSSISRNNGQQFGDRSFNNVSANASASYRFSNQVIAQINMSTAWRPPQVNELFSDGLHHGAARIEKGDQSLNPERANSIMGSLNIEKPRWQLEVVAYHKRIDEFIYLKPVYPPELTIRGAFPTFQFAQTDARFNGIDVQAGFSISSHVAINAKAAIIRAWDISADDWVIQMPPDTYTLGAEYKFADGKQWKESFVGLNIQAVMEQTRVPGTGPIEITKPDGSVEMASDYAPPPPGYALFGLDAGTSVGRSAKPVKLVLSVSNLFNTVYRNYMNAFRYYADDMGINVSLKAKITLGKN